MGSMVFTSKGGVRRGCTFANVHMCQAVLGCIFLLLMCEIHIPWWLWVCGSICCNYRSIGYRSHSWIFCLLALLVVMPTSVAAARPPTNLAAMWRQPAVCKFRSEGATVGMAVQCFNAWRQRCTSNLFQTCRLSQGQY